MLFTSQTKSGKAKRLIESFWVNHPTNPSWRNVARQYGVRLL